MLTPSLLLEAREFRETLALLVKSPRPACYDENHEEREITWLDAPSPYPHAQQYSAEDGGNDRRNLRTYTVVAAKGWAARFESSAESPSRFERGFVGLLVPQSYRMGARIAVYRQVLEANVAAQAAPRSGVALFDGSPPLMWGKISKRLNWDDALKALARAVREASKYERGILDGLSNATCNSVDEDCAAEIIAKAIKRPLMPRLLLKLAKTGALESVTTEVIKSQSLPPAERYSWISSIESLERLLAYKEALEAVLRNGSLPVFIVKTSRSTKLCNTDVPDVHMIEMYLASRHEHGPGYVIAFAGDMYTYYGFPEVNVRERSEVSRRLYPEVLGLREFYERIGVVATYARLKEMGYVLRVDVVYDMSEVSDPGQLARDALSRVRALPLSREGYPIPLITADANARLGKEEMDGLMRALGIELVPESRSVLRL